MKLSLLQLNTNSDNFWEQLTTYLTSSSFDILQLQELTGKGTSVGNINSHRDTFHDLQQLLQTDFLGELSIQERFTSSPDSYDGCATFYKKDFKLLEKKEVIMHQNATPFNSELSTFEGVGRRILDLRLAINGKSIAFLNTHFAWGQTPIQQDHQTEQGEILLKYLETVPAPFVFTGDFNLQPDQPLIQELSHKARNLTTENNVTNTLNPRTHRAKRLFPPGIAVDYIFTSKDLQVHSFSVVEEDISDHLGLTAAIEV